MRSRPASALALGGLLVALALVLAAPSASAHASRLSCEPEPGARLDAAPTQVVVVLTEPIEDQGTTMTVKDQDGERVDRDDLAVDHGANPRLTLSLQPGLADGAYTIAWKVLSKDTHTVSESCGFAVGAFQPPASESGARQDADALAVAGRLLAYSGLALALGALGLLAVRAPAPSLPAVAAKATALGAALHTAGLLLLVRYTAAASDLGLAAFLDSGVGRNMALRVVLGLAALVVAGLAVVRPTRLGAPVAGLAMLAAGIATSAYSHSFAHGVAGIAADALHLVAGATWVGALVLFLWILARRPPLLSPAEARRFGVRFGTLALACVLVLFLAGIAVSILLVGPAQLLDLRAAVASPYRRLLAGKVALALAMVAVAAVNRFVVVAEPTAAGLAGALQRFFGKVAPILRPLDDGDGRIAVDGTGARTRGLRRLVAVEAAFGAAVLVLAAMLTSISPPAEARNDEGGLHVQGMGRDFHVVATFTPSPLAGGSSRLTFEVHDLVAGGRVEANTCDASGTRDTCVDVLIGAGNVSAGAERHAAHPDGDGGWAVDDILWTFSGNATAIVRVQTADVFEDRVALAFTIL